MLDEKFIKEQKKKLLDEKTRLEDELKFVSTKSDGAYQPKFENMGEDMDDNAAEVYTYEQNLAIEKDLSGILKRVDSALARIEKGRYGQCVGGDEIEIERLRVIPWAETCIKHSK